MAFDPHIYSETQTEQILSVVPRAIANEQNERHFQDSQRLEVQKTLRHILSNLAAASKCPVACERGNQFSISMGPDN